MKFAQYLRDTQIPEWKKAYIDYRGLKKSITSIRSSRKGRDSIETFPDSRDVRTGFDAYSASQRGEEGQPSSGDHPSSSHSVSHPGPTFTPEDAHVPASKPSLRRRTSTRSRPAFQSKRGISGKPRERSFLPRNGPHLRRSDRGEVLSLHELLVQLSPQEAAFFSILDAQLVKVEMFYMDREKELSLRTQLLQKQLHELHDHKKLVQEANGRNTSWTSAVATVFKLKSRFRATVQPPEPQLHEKDEARSGDSASDGHGARHSVHSTPAFSDVKSESNDTSEVRDRREGKHGAPLSPDREDYLYAKKKLKKAVLEHYRGMMFLQNYRILNITGFRKALKKFEKVTKIPIQNQYMTEKVERSGFASDKSLQAMMKEMQELYAQEFLRGDMKKALKRLRGGRRSKTHHFSSYRSGIWIGLAIPALAAGIYNSSLKEAHEEILAWDALLFIYGLIFIPVLFSILIGVNLIVWARSRINYTFIFELDVRTRLDYREYFEIPSFLFATLCYAFWLSFARIGSSHISPTTWPLVWLGLMATIMFNPLRLLFRSSRYWLIKRVGYLFLSGTKRVEFSDFWIGDQFCSLVFTLSNLPSLVCMYADGFAVNWNNCGAPSHLWPASLVLAALPSFIRVIQSIARYVDSGLVTHLINGGKYATAIVAYLFYYIWRHQGTHFNTIFILWCLCNTCYSAYAASWDLLMDWSLLRPHATHRFLRDELGYSNHVYAYYSAIITNVLIRFAWVFYIPQKGPSMQVRTFIVGFLEMLRRFQWNFYRLENEHLGNMDQYRVTREVPLPYAFDESADSSQNEDGDEVRSGT